MDPQKAINVLDTATKILHPDLNAGRADYLAVNDALISLQTMVTAYEALLAAAPKEPAKDGETPEPASTETPAAPANKDKNKG